MRNRCLHIICFVLLFVSFPQWQQANARICSHHDVDKHILYINSYSPGFPTFTMQFEGIRSALPNTYADIDVEFMDCKRFPTKDNVDMFKQSLMLKFKQFHNYDGVIVSDDNAFDFALANQNTLFKGLPIVFLGVNNISKGLLQNKNAMVTGVVENLPFYQTMEVALKLFPSRDVYFITDKTPSGIGEYHEIMRTCVNKKRDVKIHFVCATDMSFDEFYRCLRKIPETSPVIYASAFKDKDSCATISFKASIDEVLRNIKAPVFYTGMQGLGTGILGGCMVSHYTMGHTAAVIMRRVLDGEDIAKIKVIPTTPTKIMFDYLVMKRYHLRSGDMPAGCVVVNKPLSVFETHKVLAIHTSVLIVILTISTILLLRYGINKRKSKKELKLARDKAEEGNRMKMEFIHNLSHEIRTPLNGIAGFSEIICKPDYTDEEKTKFAGIISYNTQNLIDIISALIDISDIEKNKVPMTEAAVDITEIVSQLEQKYEPAASKRGIEIRKDIPENCKTMEVFTDSELLGKTLKIFVDNALKFTSKGYVKIGCRRDDRELVVFVEDTGYGIKSSDKEKIFDYFTKACEHHFDIPGLGLGLTIAKKYVEMLKGYISFKSTEGLGSTFYIHLPVSKSVDITD